MTTGSVLKSIERRFPWSFLGFLAGVTFGVFGIYTVFFYAKAPELRVEIQSSAPVFSIRENVQDLDIMFKGQNIRQARKALTLINLKIVNRGNVPVKPGDFDQKDLLSLCLDNGELVKSDILETSEPYLDKVFAETTTTNQSIRFPPFIMEPAHFISLRLLVLHNENVHPTLSLKGKVANVSKIPVVESSADVATPTKGVIAFSGDVVVQFIRVAAYGLGTLAVLAGLIALFMVVRWIIERRQRRRHRFLAKMQIHEFLDSLPTRDRRAIEPIARALVSDERSAYMFHHELMPLLHQLDRPVEKLRDDPNLDMLLSNLSMCLPHFNKNYFLSSESGVKNLVRLFKIVCELGISEY